jgi:hypothetical protein
MPVNTSKPYIEVTIEDGGQKVEAHNFQGKGCLAAVEDVQKMLGGDVVSTTNKPEINKPTVTQPVVIKH